MGQRTQMIIQRVNKKGERHTEIWHFQWGFGRQMYLMLMQLVINDYFRDPYTKDYNFFEPKEMEAYKNEFALRGLGDSEIQKRLNDLEFTNPRDVGEILSSMCDNNNGGLFVRITEKNDEPGSKTKFEYAFMLGNEDGGAYDRFVSSYEYACENKGSRFSDWQFSQMFYQFMVHFDGVDMGARYNK